MKAKNIYAAAGFVAPLYDFVSKIVGYKESVDYFVYNLPFENDANFTVLDAGCGTGPYTLSILAQYENAKVVAFDISPALIGRAKERVRRAGYANRVSFFVSDIQAPLTELKGNNFNLIITAGVLEYVSPTNTIENLSRFLMPHGFFFNSPVRDTKWGRIVGKLYATNPPYSREMNIRAFEQNGFVLERILSLPPRRPFSFKEGLLFKKPNSI